MSKKRSRFKRKRLKDKVKNRNIVKKVEELPRLMSE